MATESEPSDVKRPVLRRALRLGLVVVLAAALVTFGWFVLRPSPTTVFSVNADTGAVEVRPLCADKIIWDLPDGEVRGRTCSDTSENTSDASANMCCGCMGEVVVTLLAGATAKIEATGRDEWSVTFGTTNVTGCEAQNAAPIDLRVDDELLHDELGFSITRQQRATPSRTPASRAAQQHRSRPLPRMPRNMPSHLPAA